MREDIYWVVTCAVKPGKFEAFKSVVKGLVDATREESGSLAYDYSVNADETVVQIFEHWSSSAAIVSHVTTVFAPFTDSFVDCVDITGFVTYGFPNDDARAILDGFGSTYMTPFEGFTSK